MSSFSKPSIALPTSQLILLPFCCFTYVTAHFLTLLLLLLRHRLLTHVTWRAAYDVKKLMGYERPSKWHLWAEFILQLFHHFTYVTAHSPTLLSIYLHRSSFFNPSVAWPTSQLILQPFRRFTSIMAPTLPLLHLRHSSFSSPSFASPMSQTLHLCHLASCPRCKKLMI